MIKGWRTVVWKKNRHKPNGAPIRGLVFTAVIDAIVAEATVTTRRHREKTIVWEESIRLAAAGLRHGFTERTGGVSVGVYGSLNLSLDVGDTVGDVLENRRRFCEAVGCDILRLTTACQDNEAHIVAVGPREAGAGAGSRYDALARTKALMTDRTDMPLFLCAADSVPLVLFDDEHEAAAVAVCDILALEQNLAGKVVTAMNIVYGSRCERLHAYIGPAVSPVHTTVGRAIAETLIGTVRRKTGILQKKGETVYADLKYLAVRQMVEAGLDISRFDISKNCTYESAERFFSSRRSGGICGRNAVFALLT